MDEWALRACTAFAGEECIAAGPLGELIVTVKQKLDGRPETGVLVFDDETGRLVEADFRWSAADILSRLPGAMNGASPVAVLPTAADGDEARQGPGRPRLGVVAREVTLLPRHWDWLNRQPGGASVALRKLVEEARRTHEGQDRVRQSQEAAYRFISAMAGDRVGFEEASRALFAGNAQRFDALTVKWPADIASYARKLAAAALGSQAATGAA